MKSLKIAVIGGGFFGSSIAIELKEKFNNFKIDLFEKKDDLLKGTSGKNQFRLHKGYNYPRSKDTFLECKSSNESFNENFKNCFLKSNNFYSISKYGSKVTFDQYLEYLNKVNLIDKINYIPIIFDKLFKDEIDLKENNIEALLCNKIIESFFKGLS